MKTILVTGGAGFVGSHTCKALSNAGYSPVVYDDLSNGYEELVRWGPLEKGQIQNENLLDKIISQYEPSAVIHFAGSIEAGRSVKLPIHFYWNNVSATISLLRAMERGGIRNIVFSSTAAVYGDPQECPIREDHPTKPVSPYGRTKLMIEEMLKDSATAYGLRFAALRYFNAAGADPDGELRERHEPETHLIPLALEAAFGHRAELQLYGADWDTPDGTCIRDYVHVSDLAEAHVQALERLARGGSSIITNLGTGEGHSVREVIEAVETVTGRTVPIRIAPRRPGDSKALVADARMAHRELGWRPQYRTLIEQVLHSSQHFARQVNMP